MAAQEGKYLARLFNDYKPMPLGARPPPGRFTGEANPAIPAWVPLPEDAPEFQ